MKKTADTIKTVMELYLGAAQAAMDHHKLLIGDSRRGAEIIRLACSFRQSDVIEEADMTISITEPKEGGDNSS